mgnify:CR=1 FL=1
MSIPTSAFGDQPVRPIRSYWLLFVIEGLVLLVLGALAIVVPPVATLGITIFIGWLLLISGVVGLVMTFAETGELIHPRHERHERSLSELPELPIAYADSAPFLTADGLEPAPYPVDDEGYADDDMLVVEDAPPPPRRRAGRGRLASGPRAAK